MRYCDFKKVEATYYLMMRIKNGNSKTDKKRDNEKVKQDLSKLETINASDLNLPPEYMEIFK